MLLVDGVWSAWSVWSNCTLVQCGVGNKTRTRSCDSPSPSEGGKTCEGDPAESETCDTIVCSSDECKNFKMKIVVMEIPINICAKILIKKLN